MTTIFEYAERVVDDIEKTIAHNRTSTGKWYEEFAQDSVSEETVRAHFKAKLERKIQQVESELDISLTPEQSMMLGDRDIRLLSEDDELRELHLSEKQKALWQKLLDLSFDDAFGHLQAIGQDIRKIENERQVLTIENSIPENRDAAHAVADILEYAINMTQHGRQEDIQYRAEYDNNSLSWKIFTNDVEPSLDISQLRKALQLLKKETTRADAWRYVQTAKGNAYEYESSHSGSLMHDLVRTLKDTKNYKLYESFHSHNDQRISDEDADILPEGVTHKIRVYGAEVKRLLINMIGIEGLKEIPSPQIRRS